MGWIASVFIMLGTWLVTDKNIWGFAFAALGNAMWVYIGLERGGQYDLATIALVMTVINLVGLFKWWHKDKRA